MAEHALKLNHWSPDYRRDPQWRWPWWEFDLDPDTAFHNLSRQYNTYSLPIQAPQAFHLDLIDIANEANSLDDLHARLSERSTARQTEVFKAWRNAAIQLVAAPDWDNNRSKMLHKLCSLTREPSLNTLIGFMWSHVPEETEDARECMADLNKAEMEREQTEKASRETRFKSAGKASRKRLRSDDDDADTDSDDGQDVRPAKRQKVDGDDAATVDIFDLNSNELARQVTESLPSLSDDEWENPEPPLSDCPETPQSHFEPESEPQSHQKRRRCEDTPPWSPPLKKQRRDEPKQEPANSIPECQSSECDGVTTGEIGGRESDDAVHSEAENYGHLEPLAPGDQTRESIITLEGIGTPGEARLEGLNDAETERKMSKESTQRRKSHEYHPPPSPPTTDDDIDASFTSDCQPPKHPTTDELRSQCDV